MKHDRTAKHDFVITFDVVGGDQYHADVTVASEWDDEGITHDVTIKGIKDDFGHDIYGMTTESTVIADAERAMEERLTAEADRNDQPFDTLEERDDYYAD